MAVLELWKERPARERGVVLPPLRAAAQKRVPAVALLWTGLAQQAGLGEAALSSPGDRQ